MKAPHRESLAKILQALPHPSSARSISDAARSTLALVIEPALGRGEEGTSLTSNPARCPNCDQFVASARSPYCGDRCREIAGFVRQVRSGAAEGSLLAPDRQVALGQILWRLLGGGLPLRNSLIEPKALARLMAKHEGRCVSCGAPATTVDHIGSFCNRTSNLLPRCDACAQTKPFGSPEVLERPKAAALIDELAHRIGSATPIRPCDDAPTWDWRAYVATRKTL